MARPWRIGVRQLVHQRDLWMARNDRLSVHLLERDAAILDLLARDDLQVADLLGRQRAAMRLDIADDDISSRAPCAAAPR